MFMRYCLTLPFLLAASLYGAPLALAQNPIPCDEGDLEILIIPEDGGEPSFECRDIDGSEKNPESDSSESEGQLQDELFGDELPPLPDLPPIVTPDDGQQAATDDEPRADIIIHSAKDRKEQLDNLFEQLAGIEDADKANLVAEEIWAIWLQSGSESIDYLLLRGTNAQARGDHDLAERMYNHVTGLSPDYAEGWTRAARLALEQEDLSRALHDVTQALVIEPRQFYALWTLGNIFERLGQIDEAFEAYSEANKLYPALKSVKDRVEYLSTDVEGEAL